MSATWEIMETELTFANSNSRHRKVWNQEQGFHGQGKEAGGDFLGGENPEKGPREDKSTLPGAWEGG